MKQVNNYMLALRARRPLSSAFCPIAPAFVVMPIDRPAAKA
jgi:hypothetical protein